MLVFATLYTRSSILLFNDVDDATISMMQAVGEYFATNTVLFSYCPLQHPVLGMAGHRFD